MYLDYWQLDRKPFEPTTAGGFFYPSESHQGAILKLRYALENNRGAALVTGPSGVGKTLVVETLLEAIDASALKVIRVVFPQMTTRELLSYLARRFQAEAHSAESLPVDESWRVLESELTKRQLAGEQTLIVFDEAHLLEDVGALETIRLLLNLQSPAGPLATVLLVGQSSLVSTLGRMPRLEERIDMMAMVSPLSADDTQGYVEHRLRVAGAESEVFASDAFDALHFHSQGITRRINRLGDLALLIGFANHAGQVDSDLIESVASELAISRAA